MPVSEQTDTVQGHKQNNKTVSKKKKAMTASKQKEEGKKGKSAFTVRVFFSNEKKSLNSYGVNCLCQPIFHRYQSIKFKVYMLLINNRCKV